MPCPARDMRNALTGKLSCEEESGRKHMKYRLYRSGQLIAATVISHGASELTDDLISRMARELCIQTRVLKLVYECPYGLDEYLQFYNPELNRHRRHRTQD